MRSRRVKRLLLVVLTVLLIYVWWGNVQLFLPQTHEADSMPSHPPQPQPNEAPEQTLTYRPPVVNPFRRPKRTPKAKAERKEERKVAPPAVKLGDEVRVSGILERGSSSQAVIALPGGLSQVMSVGDSLDLWKLVVVGDEYVVFKRDRARDSLWLGSKRD
jgi:Tfp pilus assembly protein PilP